MNTLSFRAEESTKQKLDILAARQNRDRSFVINQAIDYFLDLNEWQMAHIEKGLEQAEKNEFADDKAVVSVFAKWKA